MTFDDYLDVAGRKPWRWGGGPTGSYGQDCTLFTADWAIAHSGADPAAGIRGTYSTGEEANAIVDAHGGAVAFVHDRLTQYAGWFAVKGEPRDGDIGIISTLVASATPVFKDIPAIYSGGLWHARGLRGIRAAIFQPKAIWRP